MDYYDRNKLRIDLNAQSETTHTAVNNEMTFSWEVKTYSLVERKGIFRGTR
jgi:hypothetical protein